MARLQGQPLDAWQLEVLRVALELNDDQLPVYGRVVLTVPRQQGKTWLLWCLQVARALGPASPVNVVYAAQSGQDARRKLLDDHVPILDASPLADAVTQVRRSNGAEAVIWRNRSRIELVAPTETAGHGRTRVGLAVADEAFALPDDRLEVALSPTMLTRPDAQLWIVSTMGDDSSLWWNAQVAAGRAAVEAGAREGLCYMEWSADPEADPADPATWRSCMPALVEGRIREAAIADRFRHEPLDAFRRSYLNVPSSFTDTSIDPAAWAACGDPEAAPGDRVAFAVEVEPDRSAAWIVAAGADAQGRIVVDVAAAGAGTAWVAPWLEVRYPRWNPTAVIVDAAGPAGSLVEDIGRVSRVDPIGTRELAHASAALYDAVRDGTMRHRRHPDLTAAALSAATRTVVGGAFVFDRRQGTALFLAAALAHGAALRDRPGPAPSMR